MPGRARLVAHSHETEFRRALLSQVLAVSYSITHLQTLIWCVEPGVSWPICADTDSFVAIPVLVACVGMH